MKLGGKVAIVTGAGVRVGKAIALALAERGARLVVHYNASAGPAQQTVEEIRSMGSEAIAVQADLRQAGQASSILERTVAHYGQADILVAGIGEIARTLEFFMGRNTPERRAFIIENLAVDVVQEGG